MTEAPILIRSFPDLARNKPRLMQRGNTHKMAVSAQRLRVPEPPTMQAAAAGAAEPAGPLHLCPSACKLDP